jgi:DNA-binding transcriptional regulator YiaG
LSKHKRKPAPGRRLVPGAKPAYTSGAEIKRQREEAGYSQTEYGALAYRSRSIVAQWERGERQCDPAIHEYLTLLISHRATRQARLELFGVETREPREA